MTGRTSLGPVIAPSIMTVQSRTAPSIIPVQSQATAVAATAAAETATAEEGSGSAGVAKATAAQLAAAPISTGGSLASRSPRLSLTLSLSLGPLLRRPPCGTAARPRWRCSWVRVRGRGRG